MARTRTIKPEFWSDEKLARVSRESRLTYIGLWSVSDDYGVTKGHPAWIKSQLFPYDDGLTGGEVKGWLDELVKEGRIIPFMSNEEIFYYIVHFSDHQKVDHPSKSRNPEPPSDIITKVSRDIREDSRDIRVETETETETIYIGAPPRNNIPYKQIIDYLNQKTGKRFGCDGKETLRFIRSRWNAGFRLEDFQKVIDIKCEKWLTDPKMVDYLRPQTLFGTKFESYLNEGGAASEGTFDFDPELGEIR